MSRIAGSVSPSVVLRAGTFEVVDRFPDGFGVVFELPQAAVAHLTEDGSHLARLVIVVHVNCVSFTADRTDAALLFDHPLYIGRADAISPLQVIVAATAV
jgi:hypothetical protein